MSEIDYEDDQLSGLIDDSDSDDDTVYHPTVILTIPEFTLREEPLLLVLCMIIFLGTYATATQSKRVEDNLSSMT